MLKARGYIRLSEEDRNKKDESPENQKKIILNYAIRNKYDFQKFYEDIDVKGWWGIDQRHDLKKAFDEGNEYDILLIKKWSRFARKGSLQDSMIEQFEKKNIKIIPALDVEDKKGRQVLGLVNEWYIDDLRRDTEEIHKLRIKEGFALNKPPLGYYLNKQLINGKIVISPKKFLIDEKKARIIQKIFELRFKGESTNNIADRFKMNQSTIHKILRNITYIGYHIYERKYKDENKKIIKKDPPIIYKGKHNPIIDFKTFKKINPDFKENAE